MNRPSPDDMKEIMMAELREENKKLEEENEKMKKHIRENGYIDDVAYIKKENARLKEENKKLKEENERLYDEIRQYEKGFELGSAKED